MEIPSLCLLVLSFLETRLSNGQCEWTARRAFRVILLLSNFSKTVGPYFGGLLSKLVSLLQTTSPHSDLRPMSLHLKWRYRSSSALHMIYAPCLPFYEVVTWYQQRRGDHHHCLTFNHLYLLKTVGNKCDFPIKFSVYSLKSSGCFSFGPAVDLKAPDSVSTNSAKICHSLCVHGLDKNSIHWFDFSTKSSKFIAIINDKSRFLTIDFLVGGRVGACDGSVRLTGVQAALLFAYLVRKYSGHKYPYYDADVRVSKYVVVYERRHLWRVRTCRPLCHR